MRAERALAAVGGFPALLSASQQVLPCSGGHDPAKSVAFVEPPSDGCPGRVTVYMERRSPAAARG